MEQPKADNKKLNGNPEAINDAYKLFTDTGYKKSKDEFVSLINSNPEALKDAHKLFVDTGYKKDLNEFSNLLGVKKKDASNSTAQKQNSVVVSETISSAPIKTNPELTLKDKQNAEIDEKYSPGSVAWSQEKLKLNVPNYTSVYDSFKEREKVSDEVKTKIAKEVDDEVAGNGFMNNAKSLVGAIVNPLYRVFAEWEEPKKGETRPELIASDPLEKEKAEIKKQYQKDVLLAKSQKKQVEPLTSEILTEKAKELKIQKRIKSESDSQVRGMLKEYDSDPTKKEALIKYTAMEKTSLSDKDKLLVGKQNVLQNEIDDSYGKLQEITKQAKQLQEKGIPVSDELKGQYVAEQDKYNSALQDAIKTKEEYISNTKKLGEFKDNLDVFKRDYGWIKNFVGNLTSTSNELAAGAVGAIDYGYKLKSSLLGGQNKSDEFIQNLAQGVSEDIKKDAEKTRSQIMKPIDVESIDSGSDLGSWFLNTVVASQIPIFATVATGVPGITALGVSATGTKFEEMQTENAAGTSNYSDAQLASIPAAFGVTETISATVDRMLLGNASRVVRSATAPERSLIAKSFWESAKNISTNTFKGGAIEGLDESGTQIAQNIIDKFAGDKKDIQILDGVKDAGAAGVVMGMLLPVSSSVVAKSVKSFSTDNKIQKASADILSLQQQIDYGNLSEGNKKIVSNQVEQAKSKLDNLLKTKIKGIEGMSDEHFQEVVRLEKTQANLKDQARKIELDENLSDDMKKQIIGNLQDEFTANDKRRVDLIERGAGSVLSSLEEDEIIKLKDKASRELMKEKNPDGTRNIKIEDAEISKRAGEIYNKEQREKAKIDEQIQNPTPEVQQETQPQAEVQKEEQEKIVGKYEYNGEMFEYNGNNIVDSKGEMVTLEKAKAVIDQGKLIKNETAPSRNPVADGNIQPGTAVVDENGTSIEKSTDGNEIQATADNRASENIAEPKTIKIKTTENSDEYDVTFNGGRVEIKDKNSKEPSINTRKKIEEKYSEQVNFIDGAKAYDEGRINDVSTWEEDVAEHSKSPIEVAETIMNLRAQDATEFLDTKSKAIAEAIGEKSVERESFNRFGDRNSINQSIALQYFAKKGLGQGIDQIAMAAEEAIYGDYDATNPRITEQDVVDFIIDNPGGTSRFMNEAKNNKMKALKSAFESLTGLPANDKYLAKAIDQAKANDEFVTNYMTGIDTFTDEELLSLQQENEQSERETYGTTEKENNINSNGEGISENESSAESEERSGIQEESGRDDSRKENRKVNLSKDSGLDSFIENLDKAIRNLDDFGKETLGMNLPLVVAKQALLAMKIAAQTASTVADIISAGLNAVKATDWYKNLSSKEQIDIDANFVDYLNKPYATNRQKSRFKIEEEIKNALSNGVSESDILDGYSERREKMIAKDYLQRQKSVTEEDAKQQVDDSFQKADEMLTDKKSSSEQISLTFRKFMAKIVDRQFVPKFVLNKAGGKLVRNYLIATKGATGYAKVLYDQAHEKIYKGLSSKQIKTLDKVIQLRRFIAIDENRAKNDLPNVVHPDYINKNVAEAYLKNLESELGQEEYTDLIKRADAYFDAFRGLLDEMQKSGIISKESRDQFFDIDYQPRQFLQFLKNTEEEVQFDAGNTAGLSQPQIKKLEDGLDTSLVYDSQYLLSRSINARTKSIAMNNTNRKLAEFVKKQGIEIAAIRQKNDLTKKEKETIKYFDELAKKVIPNTIVGFSQSGEPKYKFASKDGFKNAYYYVNGVKNNILMEASFHDQYYDNVKGIFKDNSIKETVAMASGVGLVKAVATGSNPTFFITNTPRDFMFISTFSEEYGKNVLLNMAKLSKDTFLGIKDIVKSKDSFKNFIQYGGMMDFLKDQGKFKGNKGLNRLIDKIDNKNRERLGKAFDFATLSKLQTYSEIGFRMAVFNRSIKNQLKELGLKDISEVQDKDAVDDIYTNAVASARGTMDFNQGGIYTKDADALVPYLNAATQGTRVMFDNFRERPLETTLRVIQTSAILSSAAIGTSIALLSAYSDDEEESGSQLYQKARKGLSQYEKTNYFIVFTGKRTADGEFEYYRIAKSQQLTPFFSLTEGVMNNFIKQSIGDESADETIDNVSFALGKNISPVDLSITGNVAKNPILKAALTYSTGYDFYREQDLSYLRGKVPVQAEGFENKNVEDFYKKIGEEAGMSPVRMKGAVESLITTSSTSPYVGFLYGGLDAIASDKDGKEILTKLGEDLAKSTIKRAKKETSDFNRRMSNNEELKKKFAEVEIENSKTRLKFKRMADGIIDKSTTQEKVMTELLALAKENPFEAKRLKEMIKDRIKNQDVSSYVFEIKYAKSAEHKAILLVEMFGDNLKDFSKLSKEEINLVSQLKKMSAINKEVIVEYSKIVNEKAAD